MRTYEEILTNSKVWNVMIVAGSGMGFVKLPDCGTCSVIFGSGEDGYEHISVSPKHKFRIPSWEDMCVLKEIFFEDEEEVYQIHPKKSEYVNLSKNCLHLWKPIGHELGELVNNSEMYEDREENGDFGKWIPCSERLPEESDYYLACVYDEEADDYDIRKNWFAHLDDYDIEKSEWRELYQGEKVVAWTALPEPYKGADK